MSVLAEHFDEAAHVRPLEVARKIDGEGEITHRSLHPARLLSDDDRVLHAPNANPVDGDVTRVGSRLDVR